MREEKPYFTVIIPLYNKENLVKKTIESVLAQTLQNFELLIVNDGSKDDSLTVVKSIKDNKIRIINQENQGVSVARNNGIKEAKAPFIAFLDADDIWLPDFLETIYKMTINFPNAGLYSTQYEKMDQIGNRTPIKLKGLPSKKYTGILPNYFKSIILGDNLVCSIVVCIPKKIFEENNIWFPPGEKYGEDQYVWSRIAMLFDIIYDTKVCALYMIDAENNTRSSISKEKEPHKSIMNLIKYKDTIQDIEKIIYFDKYIQKNIWIFIFSNIKNGDKPYAIKQFFRAELPINYKIKFLLALCTPLFLYPFFKKIKKVISN